MHTTLLQISNRDLLSRLLMVVVLCCILGLFVTVAGAEEKAPQVATEKKAEAVVTKAHPVTEAPVDPDKDRKPSLEWGTALYNHYCIPCHGINGDGNGFNAAKLIVKPANHTDAAFMSARNDQKLFDTINLGGIEVAKSTLMPPWGAALNNDNKIKSLVLKLRDLCKCKAKKNW